LAKEHVERLSMKIVVRANFGAPVINARVKELVGDDAFIVTNDAEMEAAIPEAEVLVIPDSSSSPEIARILREKAKRLEWIQMLSAGYDATLRNGIPPGVILTNAGDAYAPSVATHAMALLLSVQKRFPPLLQAQRRHHWAREENQHCRIPFDSTAAVIGFGHIGQEIGRLLKAFGAHVVAVNRHGAPHPHADEAVAIAQLHDVLPRADSVVIAIAANEETRHLIGARELALMKPGAVLVNIARGYIVDGMALAEALKKGTIGGAGLDVTEPEPLPADHPLWDAPNLMISPHSAGASGAVMGKRLAKVVGENIARRLKGEKLSFIVRS
jgi:phosphoglycerate dehydrogenase-like enzyme